MGAADGRLAGCQGRGRAVFRPRVFPGNGHQPSAVRRGD